MSDTIDTTDRTDTTAADDGLTIGPDYVATLFDLQDRVAVVTGAGSGLGAAIAIGYAQAGVDVVLADVNEEAARQTAATIGQQGGRAHVRVVDVTSKAAVDAFADTVVEEHGRVDILVNSAGTAFRSAAEDYPEERFDFIIGLNLKGTYLCCQAFGRKMLAQGKGSIINLGSIGSFIGYP
jgi:NAD(P)-dependent dehydrogenase (short-subunit alcohol dehydrogenase family)